MVSPFNNQPDTWLGRCIGDRYQIERLLDSGGMGDVFLATDIRLGKLVALKLLRAAISGNQDFRKRFERECAICAALKSEHIVQVTDYDIASEGHPFYVMEYLQGETLDQVLSREPRLSIDRTLHIVIQACAGLQLAHEGVIFRTSATTSEARIKVVHRDLKPSNIFLVPTAVGELVKIIDFGIAKIRSLQSEATNVTTTFLGTYHYAAPEQFGDPNQVDERTDIYSLGIIVYEMLTGVDPFGFDFRKNHITGESWISAHLLKSPQPLRSQPNCESLSPALEAVVMRCLDKNPAVRFPSMDAFSRALRAASIQSGIQPIESAIAPVSAPKTRVSAPRTVVAPVTPAPRLTRRRVLTMIYFAGGALGGVLAWGILRRFVSQTASSSASSPSTASVTLNRFTANVATVNAQGQPIDRRSVQVPYFSEDLGHGSTIDLVAIPGGAFRMGAAEGESGSDQRERPPHLVTVAPFYIGKFAVTQAHWRSVAHLPKVKRDLNPDPAQFQADDRPVEQVSWGEAVEFCDRLSQKTGRSYRLPSEAEWEYACRAGTTTPFHFGVTLTTDLANYDGTIAYAAEPKGQLRNQTQPVGSFGIANAFGLYDMHGNVWEWCADMLHENYENAPTDGSPWIAGGDRAVQLLRGGSWGSSAKRCRSASRFTPSQGGLNYKGNDVGFRVVCTIANQSNLP